MGAGSGSPGDGGLIDFCMSVAGGAKVIEGTERKEMLSKACLQSTSLFREKVEVIGDWGGDADVRTGTWGVAGSGKARGSIGLVQK